MSTDVFYVELHCLTDEAVAWHFTIKVSAINIAPINGKDLNTEITNALTL